MDLFEYMRLEKAKKESPLAVRMRPRTLDEVVGQSHIIGKNRLLYRAIQADKISSLIFYGPPGTGKTTLAKVIANTTSSRFVQLNATTSGKKEYYKRVEDAIDKSLSEFEKQVLARFIKGESYVTIAEKLDTQVKSVDNAIQRIRKKAIRNIVDGEDNEL